MNEFQINLFLQKNGLKKADLARELHKTFDHLSENYAKKMVYGLISGREWHEGYATWLNNKFGLKLTKPEWAIPVRKRLKRQAA